MKKFFIVLTLSLVLGVSLCGCLQWLEIPDEHYSQASAELINENASDNARELMRYLKSIYGKICLSPYALLLSGPVTDLFEVDRSRKNKNRATESGRSIFLCSQSLSTPFRGVTPKKSASCLSCASVIVFFCGRPAVSV